MTADSATVHGVATIRDSVCEGEGGGSAGPRAGNNTASNVTAYSGLSYWLSTTTPVPGNRLRTSLAASIPSFWNVGGMRISVTSTCGRSSTARATSSS